MKVLIQYFQGFCYTLINKRMEALILMEIQYPSLKVGHNVSLFKSIGFVSPIAFIPIYDTDGIFSFFSIAHFQMHC